MTVTRKMIHNLRADARMHIDQDLEAVILQRFGTEPYPYTYTEQDLYEQIRKLVMRYNTLFPPARTDPVFLADEATDVSTPDGTPTAEPRGGDW